MDAYKILLNPLSTEKAIRLLEAENKLLFAVDKRANKIQIRSAVEELFKVKVVKVNTFISFDGVKKAYVKLAPEFVAMDVATKLGMI